jgi:UDP-N-acetylglucosamine/UDP-N-acetylgalactosamine diphosphorylase
MTVTDPIAVEQHQFESLKRRYTKAGQGHLLTFWDQLSQEQQRELYDQLREMDIERVNQIFKKTMLASENKSEIQVAPLPDDVFDTVQAASPETIKRWNDTGLQLISEGKIAVILMAGGQGTRLGSSAPKGCYDINLPSHKSLFQLQAERILRLQNLAKEIYGNRSKSTIPWYIMTSGPTYEPTFNFFKANKFFGLEEKNVTFFQQGMQVFSPFHYFHPSLLQSNSRTVFSNRHSSLLDNGRKGLSGDKEQGTYRHDLV